MIDPYLLEDKDERGKWWCFFKQRDPVTGRRGTGLSWSYDLKNWTYSGHTDSGENVCVLVEGDDTNEPVADAVRSILDGHVLLSRDLAMLNHYPAVDILGSISRVMEDIVTPEHKRYAGLLKETLAVYRRAEDLINIGAYVAGSNPRIDFAVQMIDRINTYLRQDIDTRVTLEESISQLAGLFGDPTGPAASRKEPEIVGTG